MSKRKPGNPLALPISTRRIARKANSNNFEVDERNNVAFIPDPDYSGDSDSDNSVDYESDLQSSSDLCESDEESKSDESELELNDDDDYDDFFTPKHSYARVSAEYDSTKKKLEEDYVYDWIPGEKVYSNELENDISLSDKDKQFILSKSFGELFELFISINIKKYIIERTNLNGYPDNKFSLQELNTFIGIIIFTSFNRRHAQRDYWSTDPFLHAEPVSKAMSRNKFEMIKSFLKLSKPEDEDKQNKVWRVQKIVDIFKKNLLQFGIFSSALPVDEMTVKFFGKVSIKQFIKSKPTRYGIKLWGLCSSGGYLFNFDIYCGKNSETGTQLSKIVQGSRVVITMLQPLLTSTSIQKLDKFHVYFDNLFCCTDLLIHLKKLGLKATAVVRRD